MDDMNKLPPVTPPAFTDHRPIDVHLTSEQAEFAMQWWVNELRLTNWIIDFKILRSFDIGSSVGWSSSKIGMLRAKIRLLDPCDHDPAIDPYDMEATLVHELLHVCFAAWHEWTSKTAERSMSGTEEFVCFEEPIERLALTLVKTRRENPNRQMPWDTIDLSRSHDPKSARTVGAQRAP